MAYNQKMHLMTFNCASSCASQQFSFVKRVANGVAPVTSANDLPVGVLQNSPTLGGEAVVAISGVSKLRAGGTNLTRDLRIVMNDSGNAVTATSASATFFVVGRVLDIDATTNANGVVTGLIDCSNPGENT